MNTGLILRGRLLGTKDSKDTWTDKQTGELKERNYKEIGIEIDFINGFNIEQKLTKTARIFDDKLKDSSFIKAISESHLKLVEVSVFVNYGKLCVESDAILTCFDSQLKQAV